MVRLIASFAAFLALTGCASPGSAVPRDFVVGSTAHSMVFGGLNRGYRLHIPARIFATGISNGGMMSYALACNTDLFAAIGPDSATQLGPCPSPRPTSVMHIHGSADRMIRYDGGPGEGFAHIDGPPVPDVTAFWRTVDHCSTPAVTTGGPVTTSTSDCPGGRSVTLITIDGAGHQWPGSQPLREGADPPSPALNATTTLWSFFAAHPNRS